MGKLSKHFIPNEQRNPLISQFVGPLFWIVLSSVLVAHVVSFFTLGTVAESVMVVVIGVLVFGLSLWKLEYGLYFAFAELFVGSHGHLFDFGWFSVRMAIFAAVMLAWLVKFVTRRIDFFLKDYRIYPYLLLVVSVIIGTAVGLVAGNDKMDVFNDMNAYLFLGYLLPVLSIRWTALRKRSLLEVLAAGGAWIVVESLALFYVFTHASEDLERLLYIFFRDARIAEITRVSGDVFRVFMQSQFTVVIVLIIATAALFYLWQRHVNRNFIALSLIGLWAAVILSMSRSFWVGLAAGLGVLGLFVLFSKGYGFGKFVTRVFLSVLMLGSGVLLLWNLLAVPFPQALGVGDFGSILSSRATDLDEAAARSRWSLIGPMMEQIGQSPLAGRGFGTIVEYESDDPRVQKFYGGVATTYAFEWGFLDLWLKMGLLGLAAFVWIFVMYIRSLFGAAKTEEHGWLMLALGCGLIALYATHIFSPYLNHPIGLGFLVFLMPFLDLTHPHFSFESIKETVKQKTAVQTTTPAMTSKIVD